MLQGWQITLCPWQLTKTIPGRPLTSPCAPGHFPTRLQHRLCGIFYQFPGKKKQEKAPARGALWPVAVRWRSRG